MISTVGELKKELEKFYDGQPISIISSDNEEYQILRINTSDESECLLVID